MDPRRFLPLVLLSSTAFADATPPHGENAKPAICLELIAMAPVVADARDLDFAGHFHVLGGRYTLHTSEVEILDEKGQRIHLAKNAFVEEHPATGLEVGQSFSSNSGPSLPKFPDGRYRARWTVDGASSSTISFTVGKEARAPLTIEPLDHPCGHPSPSLAIHLRNDSPDHAMVTLPAALMKSSLVVDGIRYPRGMTMWAGPSELAPGRWWSTVVSFDEYRVPAKKGKRRVSFEMAEQRSSTVDVTE
jgi:hypothetical protein